ncbi:hypothetical protein ACOSQ4_026596 [Xanthoceras sorbifolium]
MVGSVDAVLRRGAWTEEEDKLLRKCIEIYGEGKWHQIPLRAGLNRCRKSCRLRWLNYLKPNIKRGDFQPDEVDLMIRLHKLLGNRWALIAGRLPGRTSNDVKNYWNTRIKKKLSISTTKKVIKNQEIPKTVVIKPRPRTFSKTSPWLRQKQITVLENDSNPSDPTMDPLEKDNNNNNTNYNAADDDDIMWWKSVLDDNGGSTCSTRELGEKPITHLWVDEENIAPAAAMEIGDNTAMELGQLDWWSDISFEEDLWDILIAI